MKGKKPKLYPKIYFEIVTLDSETGRFAINKKIKKVPFDQVHGSEIYDLRTKK